MAYEYMMGCPECSMSAGMNSPLSKSENGFMCATNPAHKYTLDSNGFLKSL